MTRKYNSPAGSIIDAQGRHLRSGKRGEVVVQGPNVIRGYENNLAANASSFVDGWFRTGDQGYLDADGYLHLVARAGAATTHARKAS